MYERIRDVELNQYDTSEKTISLGTFGSRNIEYLKAVRKDGWETLSVVATFKAPYMEHAVDVQGTVDDVFKVPDEALVEEVNIHNPGTITFTGRENGQIRISKSILFTTEWHGENEGESPIEPTPSILEQILEGEHERQLNEQRRESNEDDRERSELIRAENEDAREQNEQQRIENENIRISAEEQRELNEQFRQEETATAIDNVNSAIDDIYHKAESGEFNGKDGYTPIKNKDYFDGKDGEDGTSAYITSVQTADGADITTTDARGTNTVHIKNGKDGKSTDVIDDTVISAQKTHSSQKIQSDMSELSDSISEVENTLTPRIEALEGYENITILNNSGSMTPKDVHDLSDGIYYLAKPVHNMASGGVSAVGLISVHSDYVNNFDYGNYFSDFNGTMFTDYGSIDGFGVKESTPVFAEIDEHLDRLDEKVADIELAKFPNAIIVGEPSINNGQVSDFTQNDYLQFPFLVSFGNRRFTIEMAFTTGSNVTTQENIIDSPFGLAFAVKDGHFLMAVSGNGTSWQAAPYGTYVVKPNTPYYVKLSWNGLLYKVEYSLDKINYVTDITLGYNMSPYPEHIVIGIGDLNTTHPRPFGGIINLNYCALYINDELVWQGMDDVGLATRMSIDMANIDDAGIKKVQGIVINDDEVKVNQTYSSSKIEDAIAQKVTSVVKDVKISGESIVENNAVDIHGAYFAITEDIVTVTTDDTKGVAPYSTSYGYTNIEINKDAGVRWVEGGLYAFIVDTKMVVTGTYRNVRVRIGGEDDGDVWHPLFATSGIASGSSFIIKAFNTIFQYKSVYFADGALHVQTDNNTTYAYLVNSVAAGGIIIDDNGYGARYSLIFPTTPLSDASGIVADERWSSLVSTSSSGTTKKINTGITKFYIDRHPQYIYSANIAKGTASANATYQDYTGFDIRYSVNTSTTYISPLKKVFLWLKNFDESDLSFEADATVGNVMSLDKIATRFPNTVSGDVYLYFLGWCSATWYTITPAFTQANRLFKYTPSTGEFHDTGIIVG